MQIVYKKSVKEKVLDAINSAKIKKREIDYIELEHKEFVQLKRDLNTWEIKTYGDAHEVVYQDTRIVVRSCF